MAINKIDPNKIIKIVSIQDEAIDIEATGETNFNLYKEKYDISLLKFKKDEFPTIFHISNILSYEEAKIKQDHLLINYPDLSNLSVNDIKNPEKMKEYKPIIKQVNTQEMTIKYFNFGAKKYEENGQVFECNPNVFPFSVVQEIGAFIMLRTQIGDELKN